MITKWATILAVLLLAFVAGFAATIKWPITLLVAVVAFVVGFAACYLCGGDE